MEYYSKSCLIAIMSVSWTYGDLGQNYLINELKNNAGIYRERLGTLHLTTQTWRIDININLTDFNTDVQLLMNSISTTRKNCKAVDGFSGCEMVSRELSKRQKLLEDKLTELYLIMHPQARVKRDLLDKVGRIGNVLFGLMDSEDSKKIYQALDNLNADSTAIHEDVSHHRTVINSVIRAFNETTLEINTNFRNIKSKLTDMEQLTSENAKEIQLTEVQAVLFSHVLQLDNRIEDLIEIVQKAHDGTISGKLFRLPKFAEALSRLHRATQQELKLPFDIEKLHLRQLNSVADIVGHYLNNNVILSIIIPLAENSYEFYKITSIPIPVGNGTFGLVDNNYPFVADNGHGDVMLLTREQFERCIAIDKTNYACKHSMATYSDRSKNCIRQLINGQVPSSVCDIKGFKIRGELWEPLASDNTWLFVVPKRTMLNLNCPTDRSIKEVEGVGILYLSSPCRAYTSEVQMIAVTQEETLAALTISIDTAVLNNYNFSGLPDLEIARSGLGHVDLQEVGTRVPLLPIANITYQQRHTQDLLYNQSQQLRIYESLLLGAVIGGVILLALYITYRNRLTLWRLLFQRNKTSQTDTQTESQAVNTQP